MIERSSWIKSSYTHKTWNDFNCVEIRTVRAGGALAGVEVRDSKDPLGPMLSVAPGAWQALVATLG